MLLAAVLVAATAVTGTACGGRTAPKGTISTERFVETNVALRQIPADAPDGAERRDSVLRAYGVTEDQLRGFVGAHAADAAALAEAWSQIRGRLAAAEDSATAARDSAIESASAGTDSVDGARSGAAESLGADSTPRIAPPSRPVRARPPADLLREGASRRAVKVQ